MVFSNETRNEILGVRGLIVCVQKYKGAHARPWLPSKLDKP